MEEDYEPTVQHQRRVNPKIHDVIKKEVEKLLDAGLIYPISDSPWVSPVHCVPKKGGMTVVKNDENDLIPTRLVTGWRVCIDYRKLNEATRKDHFPLPFMDQMLERLAGNQYYCFLDGFSGYFQIPIDPKDQEKTTFTCPYGTFAYRRMPFGLCNAPGTFQRCMMAIFHDMIEKIMEVFMDDFSVFGDSFSTCLSHLEKMLKRCEDTNLVLNWEKSHFMVKEGIVLGHKISKSGIEVDRAKVDVIAKLPHPTTVKGKANVVTDALSRKERVKPRRVRAMAMIIQYGVRGMILAAQSEAFKQENGMMRTVVMDEAHASRLRWMIYLVVLADAAESVRDTIGFEYCLASSSGWTKSPVLWAEIGESSLTGPELVLDMTDKVVLIKEKLKAARDRQKSYADNRRKPLEFEVGDRVMLKVSPWKGVIRFGKKGKLAPSLHVPLDEIKVDKTLRFVEEPVENSDREVKRFLTSLLDDGRGSGSWMFLFVWSGYAAMRTLLWAGKVLREYSFQNIRPRRFLRLGSQSNVGCKKSCQSSEYGSDLGQITSFHFSILYIDTMCCNDIHSCLRLAFPPWRGVTTGDALYHMEALRAEIKVKYNFPY
ncbi:reverse transcriptase domain-containing protein [Tanacetum coccineum]